MLPADWRLPLTASSLLLSGAGTATRNNFVQHTLYEVIRIIGGEFNLWVPTADFYASDGYRIDRQGVIPDIVTEPEEALDKALELIGKTETGGNGDL